MLSLDVQGFFVPAPVFSLTSKGVGRGLRPVVFVPCTLVRTWGTRPEEWLLRAITRRESFRLPGDEKTIRDGRFVRFLALVQTTVAALSPLVIGNGLEQMDAAEIWPEAFGNVDLGISHLPQQKV